MIGLAPYRISIVSEKGDCFLSKFDGKEDFLDFIDSYLRQVTKSVQSTGEGNRLYRLAYSGQTTDMRCRAGLFETGEFGYTSSLFDTEKGRTSYMRGVKEAEFLPFFFSVFVPQSMAHGILILQRFKNLGIRKIVVPHMIAAFEKLYPGYRLQITKLVPGAAAKMLLKDGILKAVRLEAHKIPNDVADKLAPLFGEHTKKYELVVRASRNGQLNKLSWFKDLLGGKKSYSDVLSMRSWDVTRVKLELEINGRRRRLDINHPMTMNPTLDITNAAKLDADGHPRFESVWELAQGYAKHLLEGLGEELHDTALDRKSFKQHIVRRAKSAKQVA